MKKAEMKVQGMIIGILTLGLLFATFGATINLMSGDYDTSHINKTDLEDYETMPSLSEDIKAAGDDIEETTIDKNAFDYLSNLFGSILTPFKTVYRSFGTLKNIAQAATTDLNLMKVISDYLITLITVVVLIGIVMIKFYMGRRK